jgi:transcriptional regulator with XRE-family HTH domain
MTIDAVAAYIAALREMKGVPQRAVAEALGVSQRNITAWENGKRLPHVATLVALVEHLGGDAAVVHQLLRDPEADTAAGRWAALHHSTQQTTAAGDLPPSSALPEASEEELFRRWLARAFADDQEAEAFGSSLLSSELQSLAADLKEIARRLIRWRQPVPGDTRSPERHD